MRGYLRLQKETNLVFSVILESKLPAETFSVVFLRLMFDNLFLVIPTHRTGVLFLLDAILSAESFEQKGSPGLEKVHGTKIASPRIYDIKRRVIRDIDRVEVSPFE